MNTVILPDRGQIQKKPGQKKIQTDSGGIPLENICKEAAYTVLMNCLYNTSDTVQEGK